MIKEYRLTWTEDDEEVTESHLVKDHALRLMGKLLERGVSFTFQTIEH